MCLIIFYSMSKIIKNSIKDVNYRSYYLFGIIFISIGIILTLIVSPGFLGFIVGGLLFLFISIANKDNWYDKS